MWCWHCCHSFEGQALNLPYKYDQMRDKFSTSGIFCSWGCMKAFNIDKNGVNRGGIIGCNIVIMRKKMFNIIGPIITAPNRYNLKEFGGTMTIEEFRSGITKDVGLSATDISTSNKIEIKYTQPGTAHFEKMSQITDASNVNEPLRLKRTKPLKRNENNLEKTLGITRKKMVGPT